MNPFLISLTTLLLGSFAFGVSEEALVENYKAEIMPYVLSHSEKAEFKGIGGKKISYYSMKTADPKGVIVISPGQSEAGLKYAELLYDMKDWGYDIFIIDHRGQGFSERLLGDPVKSHVESFYDYVADFSYLVNSIVQPENYKKSILLCHSMGGAIGSGYLVQYPKVFTKAILSAPMIEINTKWGQVVPGLVADIFNFFNQDEQYALSQSAYDPKSTFEKNTITSSEARFAVKNILYNDLYPETQVGGTTNKWLEEALEFTATLRRTKNIFQIPTLMFQAGQDKWVLPGGQNTICLVNSLENCKMIHFSTSQHEILMEKDAIRDIAISKIKEFIN